MSKEPTTCKSCIFFDQEYVMTLQRPDLGICRRFPPSIVTISFKEVCTYPKVTHNTIACGEHRPK